MGYGLKLLGPFELTAPSGETIAVAGKKTQGVVALLALAGGAPVARSKLCAVLWGEREEAQARNSLRQALTALRKACAGQATFPFTVNETTAAIDRRAIDADIWPFVDGDSDDGAAVELYRGPFLEGLSLQGETAEDWLARERQRFRGRLSERLGRLGERRLAEGKWGQAIGHGERLIALDPLDEAGHRVVMRGLASSGERTRALRQYQLCCATLKAELGTEPEAATRRLHEEIRQEVGGSAATMAPAGRLSPAGERTGVAVLPFANLSGVSEQEFFADGLSEDLIAELARYRHLSVVAYRTAADYKGRAADPRQTGSELGVNFLIEGSVRQAAGRVRVAVQLVDAETGAHVWADKFDREVADIFALQDEIVSAVMARLSFNLDHAAEEQRRRDPTTSSTAYSQFLKGRAAWRNGDERLALACLQQAVGIDPDYARAQASVAHLCLYGNFSQASGLSQAESDGGGRRSIERALAADRSDPFILQRAAVVYLMLGEPLTARRYVEAAAREHPRDAEITLIHGLVRACCGEHREGVAMMERSVASEPRLPPGFHASLSDGRHLLGDYEGSLAALDAVLDPAYYIRLVRVPSLARLGRLDEAREIVAAAPSGFDTARTARSCVRICARAEDAGRWLEGFRLGGVKV